jgi:hypothetical protein
LIGLNGVDIARVGRKRHVNAVLAGFFEQLLNQEVRALWAFFVNDGGQRIQPFAGFLVVFVGASSAVVGG